MLTEVFNIVGFHLTSRLKRKQKTYISNYYGFSQKVLNFVPGMYASRSNKFNVFEDGTVDGQNLKSEDRKSKI